VVGSVSECCVFKDERRLSNEASGLQAKTRLSNQSNDSPPDQAPAKECVMISP
jgi:hypothetical protein